MEDKSVELPVAGSRKREYGSIVGEEEWKRNNEIKEEQLLTAIEGGDVSRVSAILEADFNKPVFSDREIINRALVKACLLGNEPMVSKMLMSGAVVNEVHEDGMSPLKAAIMSDCYQVVEFLLLCGAKLELSAEGDNHLHVALKAGLTSDPVIGYDHWDPTLMTYTNIVKLLVDNSTPTSVNQPCCGGYLPLSLAAASNRDAIVKALLRKGASVNDMDDKYGMTPLMHAAVAGNSYVIRLLVKQGALINDVNSWGYTPLMLAAQMRKPQATVALLKAGADPNAVSFSDGNTALMLATESQCVDIMEALLTHGADVNYKNAHYRAGGTALMMASKLGLLSAVRLLLQHGADVDEADDNGKTALTFCSSIEILELLTNVGMRHKETLDVF